MWLTVSLCIFSLVRPSPRLFLSDHWLFVLEFGASIQGLANLGITMSPGDLLLYKVSGPVSHCFWMFPNFSPLSFLPPFLYWRVPTVLLWFMFSNLCLMYWTNQKTFHRRFFDLLWIWAIARIRCERKALPIRHFHFSLFISPIPLPCLDSTFSYRTSLAKTPLTCHLAVFITFSPKPSSGCLLYVFSFATVLFSNFRFVCFSLCVFLFSFFFIRFFPLVLCCECLCVDVSKL